MKNRLTANLGLKIVALLFAAILWILVTNINDPSTMQKFSNVPVKILNTDLITGQGKVYDVLEETDVIDTVTVFAPRSIIDTLSADNIVAVADMNDLTNLNTIAIKLSTNKYNDRLDSINGNVENVKLNIENKVSKPLSLKATISGEVDEGYIVGNVTTEQNLVRISGPESVVAQITKAEVDVAVTGFSSDISTDAEIKFYDEEGNEVPKTNITRNIDTVRVKVEILTTKNVPINYKVTGTPAPGYRATGVIQSTPESVLLAGKSNVMKNLTAIEIPETALNITGLTDDHMTVIDVKSYLPDGTTLADSQFNGKAEVVVLIEQEVTRNIVLNKEALSLVNVPEGYEGTLSTYDEEFTVQLTGLATGLDAIDPAAITGTVDVQKLIDNETIEEFGEGFYDVPVSFLLPENVNLKRGVTVRLVITALEE